MSSLSNSSGKADRLSVYKGFSTASSISISNEAGDAAIAAEPENNGVAGPSRESFDFEEEYSDNMELSRDGGSKEPEPKRYKPFNFYLRPLQPGRRPAASEKDMDKARDELEKKIDEEVDGEELEFIYPYRKGPSAQRLCEKYYKCPHIKRPGPDASKDRPHDQLLDEAKALKLKFPNLF